MQYNWIWQTILIFFVGKLILRISGRKSIAQLTITQVIVMIGIGSLLIQPVSGKGLFVTFAVALLMSILMIITEYLEMKFDSLETLFTGKSVMVVENGTPIIKNLRILRMSLDRLETRLRQAGISSIEDVKYATIEVSGQLGYELRDEKKPLTQGDFIKLMNEITDLKARISSNPSLLTEQSNNIFTEVKTKTFEGNNEIH